MSLPERNIENLWKNYTNLLSILQDENVDKLIEEQGQRIIECTYSQKITEHFCGIGGLVDYSLKLAKTAKTLVQTLDYNITANSIIKCALLGEIGRIGTLSQDRLTISDSEWHKEKLGQYYNWNENCEKYSINHMTLFYMNHYSIRFNWDELQTLILLHSGSSEIDNFYRHNKSDITTILKISKDLVLKKEMSVIEGTDSVPF